MIVLRIGGTNGEMAALISRVDKKDEITEAAWRYSYYRERYAGQHIWISAPEADQEEIKRQAKEIDRVYAHTKPASSEKAEGQSTEGDTISSASRVDEAVAETMLEI